MSIEKQPISEILGERKYNHVEIAEIEPAVISLVEKLKEKLENKTFDLLISDDIGGRIPTLILRKLIKKLDPENPIRTYFVSAGGTIQGTDKINQEKFEKYLEEVTKDSKNLLIVTQFVDLGRTIVKFAKKLNELGKEYDMATVDVSANFQSLLGEDMLNTFYYGDVNVTNSIHSEHEHLAGVMKSKKSYSPYPKKMDKVLDTEGRPGTYEMLLDIFGEVPDIKDIPAFIKLQGEQNPERVDKYIKTRYGPVTNDEKEQIQENVNLAREDVNTMAERVYEKVWGKDKSN